MKRIFVLILTLALAMSLTACGDTQEAPSEPATSEASTEAPTEAATEEPAPADDAATDDGEFTGIVTNSYYYWNGDPEQDSYYFYDDGTFEYNDTPDLGISTGTWAQEGDRLTLTTDTHTQGLPIEDGGETIITPEGERMILEGSGDTSGGETSDGSLVMNEAYYWEGNYFSNSMYFFDDNSFDLYTPGEEPREGDWSLDGDTVTVIMDSGETITLLIEDGGQTVNDIDGNRFLATPDENTAEIGGSYYRGDDASADCLYFYPDGRVEQQFPDSDTVEGTFTVQLDMITIFWDGSGEPEFPVYLMIEDGGNTVVDEEGVRFVY